MTAALDRRAIRLAWGSGLCSLGLLVAGLILLVLDWRVIDSPATAQTLYYLQAPVVGMLGVLIAVRQPRNLIGWLLLMTAVADAVGIVAALVAMRGLLGGASPRGWVGWLAWVQNTSVELSVIGFLWMVLVFPNGRLLPGPRWRWAAWLAATALTENIVGAMLSPSQYRLSPRLPAIDTPLALPAIEPVLKGDGPLTIGLSLSLLVIVASEVVVRFRRARGIERSQMRWFAVVAAASMGVIVVSIPVRLAGGVEISNVTLAIGAVGLAVVLPASIGLAVMRHGLYDVDVFISRTIVYGSLAVFITAVYVGIAVGIGALIGGGKPNLGLSIVATAIVAVGFQPLRERLQRVANRLVYGERATPYEVLSAFSGRVAESYAGDEVLSRMAQVLAAGTAADLAEVWLRHGDSLRRAAAFPANSPPPIPVQLEAAAAPTVPPADHAVEVRYHGELLGALTVTKRRGETLTSMEVKLMDDLAHQAGLVLKNVGLSADLRARLEDLRASRQRLVAAQDDERRKLERDLHDGAQQHLVALKVKLGLLELLMMKEPARVGPTIVDLKADADEALDTLRGLARGIYPPLLAERGLAAALQSQIRKATLPVRLLTDGVGRFPQDAEASAYFCTLEALQNVQKYARASSATVRLEVRAGELHVEVADDGCGFDVRSAERGAGLTNMEDRVEAVGGTLTIDSKPGGTTVRVAIPATAPPRAASM